MHSMLRIRKKVGEDGTGEISEGYDKQLQRELCRCLAHAVRFVPANADMRIEVLLARVLLLAFLLCSSLLPLLSVSTTINISYA